MDFETLFWIIILLSPLLRRLFGKGDKKTRQSGPNEMPAPQQRAKRLPAEPTPFEEALRQIQEALTDAREPQLDTRSTVPDSKPRLEKPRPVPAPQPKQEPFVNLESDTSFDDKFEAAPLYTETGVSEHYHEPLTAEVEMPERGTRTSRKPLTPLQQAVASAAILDSPRSRNRWTGPTRR
jgi:hypothetical protein